MADLDRVDEVDDRELTGLFSAFDEVVVSNELMDATLAAILAETGEGVARDAGAPDDGPAATLTVLDGGLDDPAPLTPPPDMTASAPQLAVSEGGATRRRAPRHLGWRMRAVAAVVIVALVATAGGAAYAVPASRVQVTEGGTTIELGVNMFGMTVAADAATDEGRAVLDGVDVRNLRFEDALGTLVDRMRERGEGDGSVNVQVESAFGGQRTGLDSGAARVLDRRGLSRGDGGRMGAAAGTTPEVDGEAGAGGESDAPRGVAEGPAAPSASGGSGGGAAAGGRDTSSGAPGDASAPGDEGIREGDAGSADTSPSDEGAAPAGAGNGARHNGDGGIEDRATGMPADRSHGSAASDALGRQAGPQARGGDGAARQPDDADTDDGSGRPQAPPISRH